MRDAPGRHHGQAREAEAAEEGRLRRQDGEILREDRDLLLPDLQRQLLEPRLELGAVRGDHRARVGAALLGLEGLPVSSRGRGARPKLQSRSSSQPAAERAVVAPRGAPAQTTRYFFNFICKHAPPQQRE